MTDRDPLPSIDELEKRINKASGLDTEKKEPESPSASGAMRISIELVAGVGVGCFSGYYLDKWLDTSPIFFLTCFFLGLAGGAFNVYRIVKRL